MIFQILKEYIWSEELKNQGRMSIREAQLAYKIRTRETVKNWLRHYKSEKAEICLENDQLMPRKKKSAAKDPTTAALQKALQEADLKIKALNTLIDVAEEQLKIDIRKKSGAKQS